MTKWYSKDKIMRKVSDVWLDPDDVSAAEEVPRMKARFHLRNGNTVDAQIPNGKTLSWMMARLFGDN